MEKFIAFIAQQYATAIFGYLCTLLNEFSKKYPWAVIVAQLVGRSLLTSVVQGSNPVISQSYIDHLFTINCIEKMKIKKNVAGDCQLKKSFVQLLLPTFEWGLENIFWLEKIAISSMTGANGADISRKVVFHFPVTIKSNNVTLGFCFVFPALENAEKKFWSILCWAKLIVSQPI